MKKVFFISDVHLGAESKERERTKGQKLKAFFDVVAKEGEQLFVLGDFFDFWFDYPKVVFAEYFDVLCEFRKLADLGIELHIFGGNHDWWLSKRGFFPKNFGAKVYLKPTEVDIMGRRFFLAHGDGIAPSDWGYRNILRPILRNPVFMWLFRRLSAEFGLTLARIASSGSRLYTEKRNLRFEHEYEEFAMREIEDGADFVIMGHLHLPLVKIFGNGVYANIGDFFQSFTYAVFDGVNLELKRIE